MNSVIIKLTPSSLKPEEYRIRIPKEGWHLFPTYNAEVELYKEDGNILSKPHHYNPKYHELSIGGWLNVHRELKAGDKIRITVIEPMKKYRLERVFVPLRGV